MICSIHNEVEAVSITFHYTLFIKSAKTCFSAYKNNQFNHMSIISITKPAYNFYFKS